MKLENNLNITTHFRHTATSRERESKLLQHVQVKIKPAEINVTTAYLCRFRIYLSIPINSEITRRNKSISRTWNQRKIPQQQKSKAQSKILPQLKDIHAAWGKRFCSFTLSSTFHQIINNRATETKSNTLERKGN